MAHACDRCGKTYDFGNLVSHAKNRSKTLRKPNLHRTTVKLDGVKMKMRLCTKCQRIVRATAKAENEKQAKAEKKTEKKAK